MIEIQGLRKEYGDLVAVDDLTLTAQAGEVFGVHPCDAERLSADPRREGGRIDG